MPAQNVYSVVVCVKTFATAKIIPEVRVFCWSLNSSSSVYPLYSVCVLFCCLCKMYSCTTLWHYTNQRSVQKKKLFFLCALGERQHLPTMLWMQSIKVKETLTEKARGCSLPAEHGEREEERDGEITRELHVWHATSGKHTEVVATATATDIFRFLFTMRPKILFYALKDIIHRLYCTHCIHYGIHTSS